MKEQYDDSRNNISVEIRDRFKRVEEKIIKACECANRSRDSVHLLAVTKMQPFERVAAALELGQKSLGENYVQSMKTRMQEVKEQCPTLVSSIQFHLLGHIQKNKVKDAVSADVIHSIDSIQILKSLEEHAKKTIIGFVQIHQGDEASKSGLLPEQAHIFFEEWKKFCEKRLETPSVQVRGLMSIPPEGQGRFYFKELRELRDALEQKFSISLPELSMGMSADFEDAIAEGATWIRVGSDLFGTRQ